MKTWGPIIAGVLLILATLARVFGNEELSKAISALDVEEISYAVAQLLASAGLLLGIIRKLLSAARKKREAAETIESFKR